MKLDVPRVHNAFTNIIIGIVSVSNQSPPKLYTSRREFDPFADHLAIQTCICIYFSYLIV